MPRQPPVVVAHLSFCTPSRPLALSILNEADPRGWAAAQARVRNRASIMARHMFGDEGDGFAHEQVASLLHSLNIAADEEPWPASGFHPTPLPNAELADTAAQWAHAFQRDSGAAPSQSQQQTRQHEGGWAEEFGAQGGDWAAQIHGQAALPPHLVRAGVFCHRPHSRAWPPKRAPGHTKSATCKAEMVDASCVR